MIAAVAVNQGRLERRSIVTFAAISRKSCLALGTRAKRFSLLFRIGDENVKIQPTLWSISSEHEADFVLVVAKHEDVWTLAIHPESPVKNDVLVITGLHHGDDGSTKQEKLGLEGVIQVKDGEVLRLVIPTGDVSEEFCMMISEEDQVARPVMISEEDQVARPEFSAKTVEKPTLETLPVVDHRLIAKYLPWTTWVYTLPFVSAKLFELVKSGLPFHRLCFGDIMPAIGDLKALCAEAVGTCRVLEVRMPSKEFKWKKARGYPRHPDWPATVFTQFCWRHLVVLKLDFGMNDQGVGSSGLQLAFRKGNLPVLEELSMGVMNVKRSWDALFEAQLPKLSTLTMGIVLTGGQPPIKAMEEGDAFWAQFPVLCCLHIHIVGHPDLQRPPVYLFPKPTGPILPKLSSVKITGILPREQAFLHNELPIFRHSPVRVLELDAFDKDWQCFLFGDTHELAHNQTGWHMNQVDIDGSIIASSFPHLEYLTLLGGIYHVDWNSVPGAFLDRLRVIKCDLLSEGSPDHDQRIPRFQEMKNLEMASLFVQTECRGDEAVEKLAALISLPKLGYLKLCGGRAINALMAAVVKVQDMDDGSGFEHISHLVLEVREADRRQTVAIPWVLERFGGLKFLGLISAERRVSEMPFRQGPAGKITLVNVSTLTNAVLEKKPDWEVLYKTEFGVILGGKVTDAAVGPMDFPHQFNGVLKEGFFTACLKQSIGVEGL